jgi:hypothetical protein
MTTKLEGNSQSNEHASHDKRDETSYPPFKKVLPAMAAIWLAFFVVALVGTLPA